MRIIGIGVVVAATALSGCASVTRGWHEQVQFDSEPSGAEVRTVVENACAGDCGANSPDHVAYASADTPKPAPTNGPACVTPCTVQVSRRDVLTATFTKPGYQPQTLKIDTRVATAGGVAMAGNVLIGGVVGAAVDASSGASLEHFPNPAKVELKPLRSAAPTKPAPRRSRKPPVS